MVRPDLYKNTKNVLLFQYQEKRKIPVEFATTTKI